MTKDKQQLLDRLDDLLRRAESIPDSGMSIQGQSNALALLFSLNIPAIREARTLLGDSHDR